MLTARADEQVGRLAGGVGEVCGRRRASDQSNPPNPNAGLNAVRPHRQRATASTSSRLRQRLLAHASWNSASWNSASWNSASWNSASWNSASWNSRLLEQRLLELRLLEQRLLELGLVEQRLHADAADGDRPRGPQLVLELELPRADAARPADEPARSDELTTTRLVASRSAITHERDVQPNRRATTGRERDELGLSRRHGLLLARGRRSSGGHDAVPRAARRSTRRGWATFVVLGPAVAVAQLFVVVTPGNQSYHTTGVFLVAGALLLPPELVALMATCSTCPDWLKRRLPFHIQTFNIANYTLAAMARVGGVARTCSRRSRLGRRMRAGAVAGARGVRGLRRRQPRAARADAAPRARALASASPGLFSFENLSTDLVLGDARRRRRHAVGLQPVADPVRARAARADPPLALGAGAPGRGAQRPEDRALQRPALRGDAARGARRGRRGSSGRCR